MRNSKELPGRARPRTFNRLTDFAEGLNHEVQQPSDSLRAGPRAENVTQFHSGKAESEAVAHLARLIRRHRLDYPQFERLCREVRKETGLRRPARRRRLPRLVPSSMLRAFYEAVDRAGDLKHQIMLRPPFYTAVRVSELVSIQVSDVDLEAGKIFIEHGKGDKDRYIFFPESFRLILKAYLAANPEAVYLFGSRHNRPYSARRVQQIVQEYAAAAAIAERVRRICSGIRC